MSLLIAHLIGDYCLQSHIMATRKTASWKWAAIHAAFYTLPFLALTQDWWRLLIIGGTHAVIDRYRLAGYWCRWWGVGFPGVWWTRADRRDHLERSAQRIYETWDGSKAHPWVAGGNSHMQDEARQQAEDFEAPPPFLGVWLVIIVDNTMHLTINYLTLLGGL